MGRGGGGNNVKDNPLPLYKKKIMCLFFYRTHYKVFLFAHCRPQIPHIEVRL